MAGNTSSVTAQILGDASGARQAFAEAADAIKKTGATAEEANKQIADSELGAEMAQKSRLSVAKQLELAIEAEKAKGSELGTELVQLEREYAILVKTMQVMAKYGQEIPQGMVEQAAATRKAADSLKEAQTKGEEANATFSKFKTTALAAGAFALAVHAAKEAVGVMAKSVIDSAKPMADLGTEATRTQKALAGMKAVMADEEFSKQSWYTKTLALAYSALNTELAEVVGRAENRNKVIASQKLTQEGLNAAIDEETEKTKAAQALGSNAADQLALIKKEQALKAIAAQKERDAAADQYFAELQREEVAQRLERDKALLASLDRLNDKIKLRASLEQRAGKGLDEITASNKKRVDELTEKEAKAAEDRQNESVRSAKAISSTLGGALTDLIMQEKNLKQVGVETAKTLARSAAQTAFEYAITEGIIKNAMSAIAKAASSAAGKAANKAAAASDISAAEASVNAATAIAAATGAAEAAIGGPGAMAGAAAANAAVVQATSQPFIAVATQFAAAAEKGGVIHGKDGDYNILRASNMERVLSVEQTKSFEKLVDMLPAIAGLRTRERPVSISIHNHGPFSPSSADTKRQAIAHGKVLSRMSRRGHPWSK